MTAFTIGVCPLIRFQWKLPSKPIPNAWL